MDMNKTMLPCPHCGGSARIVTKPLNKSKQSMIFVMCDICGAQGKLYYIKANPAEEKESDITSRAIRAWNMRYHSDSLEKMCPASEPEKMEQGG